MRPSVRANRINQSGALDGRQCRSYLFCVTQTGDARAKVFSQSASTQQNSIQWWIIRFLRNPRL